MTTVGVLKKATGGKDKAMELSKGESRLLMDLLLNGLRYNEDLLKGLYERQLELDSDDDFADVSGALIVGRSIRELAFLKVLLAKPDSPTVSEEDCSVIEFWLEIGNHHYKDEADDS
jgi:hypothetical protein